MSYDEGFKNAKQQFGGKPHNLTMEGRRKLTVSGVEDVESFDEREIVMKTSEGSLYIAGEGLNVSKLSVDTGDVNVQGHISELRYEEPAAERRGLFGKLFR